MVLNKSVPGGAFLSLTFVLLLSVSGCAPSADKETNRSSEPNLAAMSTPKPVDSSPAEKTKHQHRFGGTFFSRLFQVWETVWSTSLRNIVLIRAFSSLEKRLASMSIRTRLLSTRNTSSFQSTKTTATLPTLQQIPGLDANEAQELIAGRPYASRDAFLKKLAEKISADELEIARGYLTQP